jgi:hypothetical protein
VANTHTVSGSWTDVVWLYMISLHSTIAIMTNFKFAKLLASISLIRFHRTVLALLLSAGPVFPQTNSIIQEWRGSPRTGNFVPSKSENPSIKFEFENNDKRNSGGSGYFTF